MWGDLTNRVDLFYNCPFIEERDPSIMALRGVVANWDCSLSKYCQQLAAPGTQAAPFRSLTPANVPKPRAGSYLAVGRTQVSLSLTTTAHYKPMDTPSIPPPTPGLQAATSSDLEISGQDQKRMR